jgi:hypothetical protein
MTMPWMQFTGKTSLRLDVDEATSARALLARLRSLIGWGLFAARLTRNVELPLLLTPRLCC